MRVLVVSTYYPPQHATASQRVHANATAWATRGLDVTVLTTAKLPDQRDQPLESPGVRVVEVPCSLPAPLAMLREHTARSGARPALRNGPATPPRGLSAVMRTVRERTGIFATIRMPDLTDAWVAPATRAAVELSARDGAPFDVVVASSGPYTTLLVAERLKRRGVAGAFIAEFRDLWTANHTAAGLFPFTLRERALERRVLGAADAVVTVTDPLAAHLRGRTRAPVHLVYNGHTGRRDPAPAPPGPPRLAYTGTLYPRGQDTTPLLRALALVRERRGPDALRLTIAGTSCDIWAKAAAAAGVADWLDLRGHVPAEHALRLQDSAHALVSIEWCDPRQGVLTAKILEYLAARAPILVTGPPGVITDLVQRAGRGCHAGDTPAAIAETIETVLDHPASLGHHGDAALIDRFSRAAQADQFCDIIQRTARAARTRPGSVRSSPPHPC